MGGGGGGKEVSPTLCGQRQLIQEKYSSTPKSTRTTHQRISIRKKSLIIFLILNGEPVYTLVALSLVKEEAASSAVCGEVWETWGGAEKSFETSPFHLEVESCNKCSSSETRT